MTRFKARRLLSLDHDPSSSSLAPTAASPPGQASLRFAPAASGHAAGKLFDSHGATASRGPLEE